MSITGIGYGAYVSPNGGEVLQQYNAGFNTKTGEYQPDKLIKHHKERLTAGDVVFGTFITLGAALGIYKGRHQISKAADYIKDGSEKAFNYIKQKNIWSNIKSGSTKAFDFVKSCFSNAGTNISNSFTYIKNKISSAQIGSSIKNFAGNVWTRIKSISQKISNFLK